MASSGNIKITPDSLRQKATKVRQYKQQHDEIIKQLTALVGGLTDIWIGESQTTFQSEFDAMKPTFAKFSNALEAYAKGMDNSANRLEDADHQAAAENSNLFSGL